MAIVPLVKIALIGTAREKETVLKALQEKGIVHLIGERGTARDLTANISEKTHEAYLYLKQCPEKRRQASDSEGFDVHEVTRETGRIKERTRELEDRRYDLVRYIEALEPWGDFIFPPLEELGGNRLWFYIVPLYEMGKFEESDLVWQCVHRDNRFAYIVVISGPEPARISVPRTHTGDKSLSELRQGLSDIDEELEDLHWRRVGLTRWCTVFAQFLADADAEAALRRAAEEIYDDGGLFVIEGWAPAKAAPELKRFAGEHNLLLRARAPDEKDTPPTLLANVSPFAGSEKLTRFYSTPAYRQWDPSQVVFVSFAVFFAMIISDAGYGLLLGLIWLLSRKYMHCRADDLCRLFGFMVAGTVVYGLLVGSYFGLAPPAGSLGARLAILDLEDERQMMVLSICIGVSHLMLAQGITLMLADTWRKRMVPLGWLAILAGGIVYWAEASGRLHGMETGLTGLVLMGVGGLLVLLFSSGRTLSRGNWLERLRGLLGGLRALTGMSKAFGDVLSYLRLFALGLASARLAVTFNELAAEAARNFPGTGLMLGVLILTLGHGLNFALALMSGVVHGLRLNFIEFFSWGLAEEGYPFRAFRRRRISVWNQL